MQSIAPPLQTLFRSIKVLIVDDEYYSRKVIRALLAAIGVENIFEAENGPGGLEALRTVAPDVVLVDWEMPGLDGAGFVKAVRSPGNFPMPNIPIIMLTGHAERWRVVEAVRLGVNEYLLKPVSSQTLLDRLVSTLAEPSPIVKAGHHAALAPRRDWSYKPVEASRGDILLPN
jgi:YesN/AraC family two-component response regulator